MAGADGIDAAGLRYVVGGTPILDCVDLAVSRGSSLAVMGPSGAGKTTLLMCLAGVFPVDGGRIVIDGIELTGLKPSARASLRLRRVGVVYQFGELLPELTPEDNVALPLLLRGAGRRTAYERARILLADLGVAALARAQTATLSGGERQRVAVARALVGEPSVVIADEPTGALDRNATDAVADLLYDLPQRFGCALVIATHNIDVARRADRIFDLGSGRVTPAAVGS